MSEVFFTSDLHLGHRLVAELRGFTYSDYANQGELWTSETLTAEHDRVLAENWDALVKPSDQVWVLGDISAGGTKAQHKALDWLRDRPGGKHLIAGNHDGCHPMHRDAHKWQPLYLDVFKTVQPFARRKINGQPVLLSHFPYQGDHTEADRYDQYRLRDLGVLLLHGHIHRPLRKMGYQIHVGLDAWNLKPVNLDELIILIGENNG